MTITEIPVSLPTIADRRATLRWLARNWEECGEAVREVMLGALVHESMSDHPARLRCTCGICLACTWEDYLTDLAHLDGLAHEIWAGESLDIDAGLPHEVRMDNAGQRLAGLEDLLLRGVGAR